jgi:hypothetical protein
VALPSSAAADSRFKAFQALPEDTYEAFLSVPLVTGGELIGVINVHHKDKHSHTPDEVALLTFVGEQMGGAIAKSRLAKHSQSAVKRMETLAAGPIDFRRGYLDRILRAIAEMVSATLVRRCARSCWWTKSARAGDRAARCSSPDYLQMPLKIEFAHRPRGAKWPSLFERAGEAVPLSGAGSQAGLCSLLSVPFFGTRSGRDQYLYQEQRWQRQKSIS